MDPTLQYLLDGCKANDRAAQKALYYRYFNTFTSIASRYVHTEADAEEVVNNAFLRIFRHIIKYSGKGSLEGWMKRIVANCCLTYISRPGYTTRSRIIPLKDYSLSDNVSVEGSTVHIGNNIGLEEKYHQEYLLQVLRHLPDIQKIVFNLYVFEEYSHSEIGEMLNMAERTSQSHLAKARKILSEKLDKRELINKMQRV
jgi:RNA polymerase sigma factor (sigma-70 family)